MRSKPKFGRSPNSVEAKSGWAPAGDLDGSEETATVAVSFASTTQTSRQLR